MNSVKDIWDRVLDVLSQQLTQTAMDTWFTDCRPVELDDCRLILATSSEFKQDIITSRFGERIKSVLSDLFATDFDLLVVTEEEARALIVSGFAENVSKELPLEYAVEMNNLIRLEMKGSIG